jgi:hypothetical protein
VSSIGVTPPLGTISGFGPDGDETERLPESLGSTESE